MQETLKGCETLGDLDGDDRRYILQGVVGRVKYGEMRSGFSTVSLSNYSLQRMDGTHGPSCLFY
jgi:hypothetical protein